MSGPMDALDSAAIARLQRIGGAKLVTEMIELYLSLAPGRIQGLLDGVAARDAMRVERAAHTIKATAGNLGAVQVQHTAQAVETAAAAGRIDDTLAAELELQFHHAAAALQRTLEELAP